MGTINTLHARFAQMHMLRTCSGRCLVWILVSWVSCVYVTQTVYACHYINVAMCESIIARMRASSASLELLIGLNKRLYDWWEFSIFELLLWKYNQIRNLCVFKHNIVQATRNRNMNEYRLLSILDNAVSVRKRRRRWWWCVMVAMGWIENNHNECRQQWTERLTNQRITTIFQISIIMYNNRSMRCTIRVCVLGIKPNVSLHKHTILTILWFICIDSAVLLSPFGIICDNDVHHVLIYMLCCVLCIYICDFHAINLKLN